MKSKARVIDTLSYSTFHEVFNSSVVAMCMRIFDKVELRCSGSTKKNIAQLISRKDKNIDFEDVKFRPLKVIERDDAAGGFLKYIVSSAINVWQLILAPRNTQLIYTNNNPLSIWSVTLLNLLFRKNIAIFCHGELDLLIRRPRPWMPSFYYKYIFKFTFKYGVIGRHTKMFVLGDSILNNVQPFLNKHNKRQFFSIEHPYFFSERAMYEPKLSQPIKIGTVGAMTNAKGLQTLLELSQNIDPAQIKLYVVGRVMEPVEICNYPNITFLGKSGAYIPRKEYEQGVENLDYILFLYPSNSYGFIASGAIFDAMDIGRPIIAIDNDYFRHLLKLPIGYIAQHEYQLETTINDIAANASESDYKQFLTNIEQLKSHYTVTFIAEDFKTKLS